MDLYNICAGFLKKIQKILGRSSSWSSPEIRFFNKKVVNYLAKNQPPLKDQMTRFVCIMQNKDRMVFADDKLDW